MTPGDIQICLVPSVVPIRDAGFSLEWKKHDLRLDLIALSALVLENGQRREEFQGVLEKRCNVHRRP